MGRLALPQSLQGIFFDQIWDKSKVWALPTLPSTLPLQQLSWHLDLTVWTTVPGEPHFDLSPRTVLARPDEFPRDWAKIVTAETIYPLELFRNGGRWVLLDGYHRRFTIPFPAGRARLFCPSSPIGKGLAENGFIATDSGCPSQFFDQREALAEPVLDTSTPRIYFLSMYCQYKAFNCEPFARSAPRMFGSPRSPHW